MLALSVAFVACGDSETTGSGDPASGDLASGRFGALAYNVAGLPEGISGSMPATFTPIIGPKLNAYDLVLLQESWQTPDPNPFAPTRTYHEELVARVDHPFLSVPAPAPLGGDPRRPEALLSDGLNRFSRFPFEPVTREAWEGCDITAADCLAFKGFSYARTRIAEGIEIDVYNLHMEAGGSTNDERLRGAGIGQILDVMHRYSAGRAILIGGDFNLHTDEEPDRTQYRRLLTEADLNDACAAVECADPDRIDKMAYRSGRGVELEAVSWGLALDEFRAPDGRPLSDHDAVAVDFTWRATE